MRFSSLANRNLKEIFRDPLTLLLGVAMPVILLFLFSSLFKVSDMDVFSIQSLTSSIVIFSFSFLIMFSGILLGKDKNSAFLTRLLTTPLTSFDFILAYILPFLPVAFFQIVVCYGVGIYLGASLMHVGLTLLVFFVMALLCISMGVLMGALLTMNQISGAGSLLITVVSLFSGAWMDLKMIGGFFEKVGYALPFAHSIDALRAISKGASLFDVTINMIWVLVYTVVFFVLAVVAFHWKTQRR